MKRLRELRFWLTFLVQTVLRRRLEPLVRARLRGVVSTVHGLDNVPGAGGFVLAANHGRAGQTLLALAAIVNGVASARGDALRDLVVIVGRRASAKRPTLLARTARRLGERILARWSRTMLRIPTGGGAPSVAALRTWRRRARTAPTLVFPEGRASVALDELRDGSGRWLAGLGAPTLPVAVYEDGGEWRVVVGAPIAWSPRADLRDLQLGLAIAALLPARLAPHWQAVLERWRVAHAGGVARRCATLSDRAIV